MSKFLNKAVYKILTSLADREKLLFMLGNKEEKELLGFTKGGYLFDIGWTNSITTGNIVDRSDNPLPWVTYPFIAFIAERLDASFEVFEFGCGNSTLYYAGKAAGVTSVENDRSWFDKIEHSMPANVQLFFCELVYGEDYCTFAGKTNNKYDVIIVDGRDRVNCCVNSIAALKPEGVIVLDDSERVQYKAAHDFFKENGFKKLDFWGMAPAVNYLKCTTIFYRNNNCLDI